MILGLEGAGGVDDDIRRNPPESCGQVAVDVDGMALGRVGGGKRTGEAFGLLIRPTTDQQANLRVIRAAKARSDQVPPRWPKNMKLAMPIPVPNTIVALMT